MTDQSVRKLAAILARVGDLERQLNTPQLVHSSLDDGSVPEKDAAGSVVSRWGRQPDGTHGMVIYDGPIPPVPSAPETEGGPVSITAIWGGTYAGDVGKLDFAGVEVYAAAEPFEHIEDALLIGAVHDPDGGRVTVARPVGDWHVGLVTLSQAGKRSAVSELAVTTATTVLDPAVLDQLEAELDRLDDALKDLDETTLPALRADLTTLVDTTLPALTGRLEDAEGVLGPLPGAVQQAQQEAGDATTAAGQAQSAAQTAQQAADQAAQDALHAAGVAEGKGEVITQISPPSGARARVENLWVRLPDHKVHIYDGTAWVAATDPDLIAAANEAAQAVQDAADAATAAQNAASAAQDAQDRAGVLEGQVGTLRDDLDASVLLLDEVRDTTLPALASDLGTLRDTTIPDLEAVVGPLPGAVAQAQSDATAAGTAASDAQQAADDAQAEAEAAALAAAGKSAVYYGETEPDPDPSGLWMRIGVPHVYVDYGAAADEWVNIDTGLANWRLQANTANQSAEYSEGVIILKGSGAEAQSPIVPIEQGPGLELIRVATQVKVIGRAPGREEEDQARVLFGYAWYDENGEATTTTPAQAGAALYVNDNEWDQQSRARNNNSHIRGFSLRVIVSNQWTGNEIRIGSSYIRHGGATPLFDGETPGFKWDGERYASTSSYMGAGWHPISDPEVREATARAQAAQDAADVLADQVGTLQGDLADTAARIDTLDTTTLPGLRQDLDTLTDTTIPNLESIVGPLPGAVQQAQADATAAGTAAGDAQSAADQAAQDAIDKSDAARQAAESHAEAEAEAARLAAISVASDDAEAKANAAQAAAEVTAAADALAKANAAQQAAEAKAQTAQDAADAAQSDATDALGRATTLEGQVGTLQTDLQAAESAVSTLTGTTLPALDDRLGDTEYTLDNFAAERVTAGTLDTARLNATEIAAAVATFIQINADQITAGLIQGGQIEANAIGAREIASLSVDAGHIVANTIGAGQINAETVAAAVGTFLELNADQITAGLIQGSQINAQSVAGAVGSFLALDADQITAGEIGADRIAVNELAVEIAQVISLHADAITAGKIDADHLNVTSLATALATVLVLDAGRIQSGTIATARLDATEIAAAVASFLELSASQITAGEIGADRIAVNELFAALFVANKITAIEADLSSFAADTGFVAALSAGILTAGVVKAPMLDVEYDDPTTGNRMSLQPDGIRLWAEDDPGEPTISLTTAGAQNFAILDDNDQVAAGMDAGGGVVGRRGSFDELRVGGDDLMETVRAQGTLRAKGAVAYAEANSSRGRYADQTGIFYVRFWAEAGRDYKISLNARVRNFTGRGISAQAHLGVGVTTFPVPSLNHDSVVSMLIPNHPNATGWYIHGSDWGYWSAPGSPGDPDIPVTLLASIGGISGASEVQWASGAMLVEDVGAAANYPQLSGYHLGGASGAPPAGSDPDPNPDPDPTPPPAKKRYTERYTSTGWATFENVNTTASHGSTASGQISGPLQGRTPYYPAAGQYATHFYFDHGRIRADLAGATVISARAKVTATHSHSGSGGTARLHVHAFGPSGTWRSSSASPKHLGDAHFSRGETRWLGVGSDEWRTGAYRGVGFWSRGSTSTEYYMQFGTTVELEIVFEK